jgi:hypothetical protein
MRIPVVVRRIGQRFGALGDISVALLGAACAAALALIMWAAHRSLLPLLRAIVRGHSRCGRLGSRDEQRVWTPLLGVLSFLVGFLALF